MREKIVLIGAGSALFTRGLLAQARALANELLTAQAPYLSAIQ